MLPKSSDLIEHGHGTSTGILWFLVFGGGSSGSCGFGVCPGPPWVRKNAELEVYGPVRCHGLGALHRYDGAVHSKVKPALNRTSHS